MTAINIVRSVAHQMMSTVFTTLCCTVVESFKIMNSTIPGQEQDDYQTSRGAALLFWDDELLDFFILDFVLMGAWTLTCIIGIIGNCLVIYLASRKPKEDTFRHLNTVVRNLAVTDFLYSILGSPLTMVYWILSKF